MDPLSTIILAANLLSAVDNIVRVINVAREVGQDANADALYVRSITEKARFAEWKRRMGVETDKDAKALTSRLPEHARNSLLSILRPMAKHMDKVDQLFEKYGVTDPAIADPTIAPGRKNIKQTLKRLDLRVDGARRLTDLLDTLEVCNNGLTTIAPPAPGYYVSGNDQILDASPLNDLNESRSRQRLLEQRTEASSVFDVPSVDPSATREDSTGAPSISSDLNEGCTFRPLMQLLYSTCRRAMKQIVFDHPNYKVEFQPVSDRLDIWATGLFTGEITIDQLLDGRKSPVAILRENILGILVDIVVTLGKHFETIAFFVQFRLIHTIEETLQILGEPSDSALVRNLSELFSHSEISDLSLKEPSVLEEFLTDNTSIDPFRYCSEELATLIECLFSTLPTVDLLFKINQAARTQSSTPESSDMVLSQSISEISLSKIESQPVKELLSIDLALIAALRESLRESKYAKYLEDKELDVGRIHDNLQEESRQIKYWTAKLEQNGGLQNAAPETRQAMMINLARVAKIFGKYMSPTAKIENQSSPIRHQESSFPAVSKNIDTSPETINRLLEQYFPNDETDLAPQIEGANPEQSLVDVLEVIRSSKAQLRKLASSRDPEDVTYKRDFEHKLTGDERLKRERMDKGRWQARTTPHGHNAIF